MSSFESARNLTGFNSCRDETIARKMIGKILEAGRQAPSPRNIQSLEFIVVEDDDTLEMLSRAADDERILEAPTSVVVVSDFRRMERRIGEGGSMAATAEMAAAVQNMRLVAAENGLASIWIGGFDQDRVSDQLKVPDGKRATSIISLGYTDDPVEKDEKFGMNEMTYYDTYGNQIGSVFDGMHWRGLEQESSIQKKKFRGLLDKTRRAIRKVL